MKKALLFFFALGVITSVMATNPRNSGVYKAQARPVGAGLNLINEIPSFNGPIKTGNLLDNLLDVQKVSFGSSANINGQFNYDERYLTIHPIANMFAFGNRAGGPYGGTANDLKFWFTTNQGAAWDSALVVALTGHNLRYPSMVTYNPSGSTNPHDMFGVFTGPITDGTNWIEQYAGSIKLDGTLQNINYTPNLPNTYLNHLDICLYCSPDGHATVGSTRLFGVTGNYTQNGFNILNGTFNSGTNKFDWAPFDSLKPLVKESARTDAPGIAWSPDGSVGYFICTAIDSLTTYNPYGVEWPVIFKSTDHGVTWVQEPPFDFSTIGNFQPILYSTRTNPNLVIPRWFNKWADTKNESSNGYLVDKHNNLHIFGFVRGTMSINPDSLNYFYSVEPTTLWDVFMTPYGSWNAIYIDTLKSLVVPSTGSYAMYWDHQCQMSRTPDGSRVFCLWTDTDPFFATENTNPDIKGMALNVESFTATPVVNFTEGGTYWGDNLWMRLAYDAFYDNTTFTSTLPVTTSIPGATGSDPLVHQYVTGITFADADYTIEVGVPSHGTQPAYSAVSANYPNPFNGTTQVTVTLQKPASVSLTISSIVGQQLSTVNYGTMNEGMHTLTINGENLTSGVYLYSVKINGDSYTKKMIVK
jgi:hypothetical protein